MPTPREAFCDYFEAAPMLFRVNVAFLTMLVLMYPFLPQGSSSKSVALLAILPLTASIVGLGICNWYCDWGRVTSEARESAQPGRRER